MYLTEGQLIDAWIDPEKIQKFAELFPNGTEVTYDLCVTHTDLFSFGKQGRSLITDVHYVNEREHIRSQYDREIMDADRTCEMRRGLAIVDFRRRMYVKRDDKDKIAVKIGYDPHNPPLKTVVLYSPPRPPTLAEENDHKNNLERIEKEHILEQALAFYKASRYINGHIPRSF
jgi:hypothetical protein